MTNIQLVLVDNDQDASIVANGLTDRLYFYSIYRNEHFYMLTTTEICYLVKLTLHITCINTREGGKLNIAILTLCLLFHQSY